MDNKTEENAYKVYESFFEAYWIRIQDENDNPFLELTQRMKSFEEHSGPLYYTPANPCVYQFS